MTEYVLEILDGDRAGETIPLGQDKVTLGRKPQCTVTLADEKVSGVHAEITLEEGKYVLRDLGSRNGTLLDGRRIEEIALSAFDTFQIGRLRIQFKEAGAEPPLAVHRIDQARLKSSKRRRGALGLASAVIVLAAAGGYYTWKVGQDEAAGGGSLRVQSIPRVAGNKLPVGADNCEDLQLWNLSASGSGFEPGGPARTGATALLAVRGAPLEGEGEGEIPDHALARLAQSITAVPGERLRLTAHLRTARGGLGAVRLRFTSSLDPATALWSGTVPAAHDDYAPVQLDLAVPSGTDRVEVEVLALLPAEGAEVLVDDLVLSDRGEGAAIELSAAGCSLAGVGGDVELRCGEETVLWRVVPLVTEGPLAGLAAAGLHGFSDAGIELAVSGDARGFRLQGAGGPAAGVQLLFTWRAAAAGVRTRGEDTAFQAHNGDFERPGVTELLLGNGPARVLVRLPGPCAVAGERAGDHFAIGVRGASELDLVVGFDEERRAAQTALREAQEHARAGRPGAALDLVRKLVDETPHDSEAVGRALRLRADLLADLGSRIETQRVELGKAEFFDTRGAYVRIGAQLDALVAAFGEHNIPQLDTVTAMRQQVETRLAEIDSAHRARRKAALEALAEVLGETQEDELQALVKGYILEHYEH